MLNFFAGTFAVAGLIAAVGPIVIHLLNRRRFRVVEWAAMDFLREAMQRNRSVMQLRDLILLLLRILAVALVGLALARPFFSSANAELGFRYVWTGLAVVAAFGLALWAVLTVSKGVRLVAIPGCLLVAAVAVWGVSGIVRAREVAAGQHSSTQPVHVVLVLDNSASMGYETLDGGNLLGRAKERAAAFVDELPPESRVSVLPLCGSPAAFSFDAHRSREEAKEAIDRIPVVDRGGAAARITNVVDLATRALELAPELPAKRVVFLSDQQLGNWPPGSADGTFDSLPELQLVQVAAEKSSNVWVGEFTLQDGIADTETPAVFLASIRLEGPAAVSDVNVRLTVGGIPVATRSIALEPDQETKLQFQYEIDVPTEPGRPNFVTARLDVDVPAAGADGLRSDNARSLVVPVVAALPVVFVDAVGAKDEDLAAGIIGETLPFRRLLAPVDSRDEATRQLVRVRHLTIDELERETLADARLVVLAGVPSPGTPGTVDLLREYVEQGGQLAILAGGAFDPIAWTETAWRDGAGILPAPLNGEVIGRSFDEVAARADGESDVRPFFLDFDTMLHRYFQLEQESLESLADLYREPIFVKAVRARVDDGVQETLVAAETKRIEAQRAELAESDAERATWEERERAGALTPADEAARAADDERRRRIAPAWLSWDRESVGDELAGVAAHDLAELGRPRVVAAFTSNGAPFLVTRQIGRGRVQFFATGIKPEWNTLAGTDAMAMFVRIFGIMLGETLPRRNFETGEPIVLPARPGDTLRYTLQRGESEESSPGPAVDGDVAENESSEGRPATNTDEGELLTVEALGSDEYGLVVRNTFDAGACTILEEELDTTSRAGAVVRTREIPLAVNGPARESELTTITAADLTERLGTGNYRWIAPNEPISLEGAEVRGRGMWRTLVLALLICLLVEMLVLALPNLNRPAAPANDGGAA